MNYLLDTNVISEWVKPRPNAIVVRWLAEADEDQLCLSILTFAEIYKGIEEMAAGQRREAMRSWAEGELLARFEGRIIDVDLAIARSWGHLMARSETTGLNLGVIDAFFAATAEVHGLTLVTRNTKYYDKLGIALMNPWAGEG